MIQFTPQDILHFREKVKQDDSVVRYLLAQTEDIRRHPVQLSANSLANWSLYYYCDDCSVPLEYHFDKPFEHRCPICGKRYEGEPYNSAWWWHTHQKNYDAAYYCGLLYLCTENPEYAKLTKDILMQYATYYPDYPVHGDIPYNGPGKANAQTLDEAIFIRMLSSAYDLIADTLTAEEQDFIKQRLIRCGAEFLRQHRHNQLHNHEVIINAAIGVAGLILGDESLIDFAVYKPYGLLYQLEHGMLEDGIWFECSLAYHYYALQNFYGYEKFAVNTKHSHISHPNYSKMVHAALNFLKPDNTFPLINDSMHSHTSLNHYSLYEFSYKMFGTPQLLWALNEVYKTQPRDSVEAFFYGVDTLSPAPALALQDYHTPTGSGVTIMRGKNGQYLLARHSPFGGEHDHYDRLGVSFYYNNVPVAADFGTTGYGAKYHYAYFKNTATHNTVVIDGKNHAPSAAKVLEYRKTDDETFLDMAVWWEETYPMPDSFTICQWSEEAYKGVSMRRRILKTDDFWLDLFQVDGAGGKTIDWVMHFSGQQTQAAANQPAQPLFDFEPWVYLKDVRQVQPDAPVVCSGYRCESVSTAVYTLMNGQTVFYAQGVNNPTNETAEFLVQRSHSDHALFANVICSSLHNEALVKNVYLYEQENEIIITLECNGQPKEYRFAK